MGTKELRENILKIIRDFIARNAHYLKGRTLDYGCGLQPYEDLVTGTYIPFDKGYVAKKYNRVYDPFTGEFECVMLIDVLACFIDPRPLLTIFKTKHLMITSTGCWHEGCKYDLSRFTLNGLRQILYDSGYEVISEEILGKFYIDGVMFPQHHGIIARKR